MLLEHHYKSHVRTPEISPFPPNLVAKPSSDVVRRSFRHLLWTNDAGEPLDAPVEVVVHTRMERCAGAYVLGDLVYTLSLLPGEEVRVFTTDRRTSFRLDSETNITHFTKATFEDHLYISAMDKFFGQLSASQWGHAESGTSGSFEAHGETNNAFDAFVSGGEADLTGSFNVNSFADFIGGMSAQASAAHEMSATATNTASAVSVGAVGVRQSIEGEVKSHVEMNYRHFRNPSRTRAVTFYFFQIRRMHHVRFWVDSISVSAPERTMWRLRRPKTTRAAGEDIAVSASETSPVDVADYAAFRKARGVVTQELVAQNLLEQNGTGHAMPQAIRKQTTFEREFSLATPGVFVHGARDSGVVADPSLFRQVTQVGSVITDELEGLAISLVERVGSGIVPAVMNKVVAIQATLSGTTAALP